MGRYAIRLAATPDERTTTAASCGALLAGPGFAGRRPDNPAFRAAGERHGLDVDFRAPRFDAGGKKVANARIVRAMIDDVLLHEEVELPGPSAGCPADETATGPIQIVSAPGAAAFGGIRAKPLGAGRDPAGWTPLAEDDDLADWRKVGGIDVKADGGDLLVLGNRGALLTERSDWRDVEVAFRAKVSAGGVSAVWLRASEKDGTLAGYALRLNADAPLPEYTGSIAGLAPLSVQLVGPETWCDVRARVRDEDGGTRVTVWVNGVQVNEALDARPERPKAGAIAIEQHHDGSRVELEGLSVR
jgi:hypothetical protein